MKKLLYVLAWAMMVSGSIWAQTPELPRRRQDLPPSPLVFKPFHVASAEVLGLGLYAASIPLDAKSHFYRFWPAWFSASLEQGLSPKLSLVVGGSVRHSHVTWSDFPTSYYFRNSRLTGYKALLGLRCYLGKGGGQGLFLQPTAKLISNHLVEYSSDNQGTAIFRDYMFSLRFGLQKCLTKHLVLSGSIGPELGTRDYGNIDRWPTFGFWRCNMSELDLVSVPVVEYYRPNDFSMYLTADANFAIGWYF